MKCYLIRHGQTEGNVSLHFNGSGTDESLTQEGRDAIKAIENVPENAALFSSPMKRARETTEIMFPNREPAVIDGFREMHFGKFEGRNHDDLKDDPDYKAWLESRGTIRIPGGDSMEELGIRVAKAFAQAYAKAKASGAHIMYIVTHGCAIMSLMGWLTGEDYLGFNPPNGAGYELEVEPSGDGKSFIATYRQYTGGLADKSEEWKQPEYTPSDLL